MVLKWCFFTSKENIMTRQSISLTEPNDEWLKRQVDEKEYSSKSELVNDLIRPASHPFVTRAASAFRNGPLDVLVGAFALAALAMQAV